MANYKYKLVYETFAHGYKAPTEKRFEDYEGLNNYLGSIMMIIKSAHVYQKINGKYEQIRSMEGHMFYPGGLK